MRSRLQRLWLGPSGPRFLAGMFRVHGCAIQVAVLVHRQLVNVYRYFFYPLQDFAGFLIEYRKVAHLVTCVNLVTVGGKAERGDVGPLVNVFTIRCQTLYAVHRAFFRLCSVWFDLAGYRHVVVKVSTHEISDEDTAF